MGNGFSLDQVATQAQEMGVFEYLIPFALTFAVVKGVLSATGIFAGDGDGNTQVDNLIAIAIGFFVAFSGYGSQFYVFMQNSMGNLAVGLLGLLGIMLLAGLVFGKSPADMKYGKWIIAVVVILVAWGVFFAGVGETEDGTAFMDLVFSPFSDDSGDDVGVPENLAGIIVIVIILAMIGWAMGLDDMIGGG